MTRPAIPLAERGCEMTGCDLSERELARARATAAASGTDVRWLRCDMRELPFNADFDAAYNVYTAFGYFEDDAENFRALATFRHALKEGGRFVFDFANVLGIAKRVRQRDWFVDDNGSVVLRTARPDFLRGMLWDDVLFLVPGKPPRDATYGIQMYTVNVLAAMFARAGFRIDRFFGDWDESEFSFESPRVIFVCTAV